MDLAHVKREYGDRLCLWGNLDPRYLLEQRTREDIEEEVQRFMAIRAPHGGFIFGATTGLFKGMKHKNICRAYDKARPSRPGS